MWGWSGVDSAPLRSPADWLRYAAVIAVLAVVYAAAAKASLIVASVNPSATPVWPLTGLALAAAMLFGYRVWPAILAGAFIANVTTAGTIATSLAIAVGNTAESVVAAYMINRFAGGLTAFATPAGVGRFAALGVLPATAISATVGVLSLALAGFVPRATAEATWLTWWIGDLAGAILITPVIVLSVVEPPRFRGRTTLGRTAALIGATVLIGLIAFSPLSRQIGHSGALAFFSIAPLMWAALYHNQRDTAITSLILACFAVWGTIAGSGPFPQSSLNESFLVLLAFMISVSLPSLALSANVASRDRREQDVETVMHELSHRSKNLLSIVQSIARQVARNAEGLGEFDSAFSARIQALAQTYDLLVARDWKGAVLHDVIRAQLAPFLQEDDGRVVLEGPDLVLKPKAAEQFGLLIHELATNSTKYGSLSVPSGKVMVAWTAHGSAPVRWRLDWRESGGPKVSPPQHTGFGHLVITQLVPVTLGGEGRLDFAEDGLRCSLDVPAQNFVLAPSTEQRAG